MKRFTCYCYHICLICFLLVTFKVISDAQNSSRLNGKSVVRSKDSEWTEQASNLAAALFCMSLPTCYCYDFSGKRSCISSVFLFMYLQAVWILISASGVFQIRFPEVNSEDNKVINLIAVDCTALLKMHTFGLKEKKITIARVKEDYESIGVPKGISEDKSKTCISKWKCWTIM